VNALKSRIVFAALVVSCLLWSGCGGGASASAPLGRLTSGNWSITGTSTVNQGQKLLMAGTLVQSGDSVSGTMCILSDCFGASSNSMALSGGFLWGNNWGDNLTLTSQAMNGEVITLRLNGTGSSFSGTYTVTGCSPSCDDQGTVTATPIPPITGTWSGFLQNPDGSNSPVSITANLTQGAFSAAGYSPLGGTVTEETGSPLLNDAPTDFPNATWSISTSGANVSAVKGNQVAIFTDSTVSLVVEIVDPATAGEMMGLYVTNYPINQIRSLTLVKVQ